MTPNYTLIIIDTFYRHVIQIVAIIENALQKLIFVDLFSTTNL
jgi:hypothetical protein